MKANAGPRALGTYRLLAELGEGGMGVVYLAAGQDGQLVALKRIRPQFLDDNEFRSRFRREVRASAKLSSPHSAAVLDSDVEADPPWLASEFVYGPSLAEAMDAAGDLPGDAVSRLANGLALALADIHATGLIHRDLKPSNVLLAADGPRVIDFGIARAVESAGATAITHTSLLVGSPGYMSPEQAEGRQLTTASDVFSLATVLYTACTGIAPFTGPGAPQTLYNVVNLRPDLDAIDHNVRRIVEPCWSMEPADRPTAIELAELVDSPAAAPWPPAVEDLTRTQRDEVAGLLAAPADGTDVFHDGSTRIQPPSERPGATVAPPPAPVPAPKPFARPSTAVVTTLAVAAIVGIIVIVMVAVSASGSLGATGDDESASAEKSDTTNPEPSPSKDDVLKAAEGDCVFGSGPHDDDWNLSSCVLGSFEVLERLTGATDIDDCDADEAELDWSEHISDDGTDVLLCLRLRYAPGYDDIGHAPDGSCLNESGSGDDATFETADCDSAEFRVTDRTDTYDAGDETCDEDEGWVTWRSIHFPDIAFTTCYESRLGASPMTVPPQLPDQQPTPEPSPKRTNSVWLFGGLGAIVLIVVAVVLVIVAGGSGSSGDGPEAGNDKTSDKPDKPYELADNTCEKIDTSKIPPEYNIDGLETTYDQYLTCLPAGETEVDKSFLTIRASVHKDEATAKDEYDQQVGTFLSGKDPEPLDGDWDEAQVAADGSASERPGNADLVVRDKTLTIMVGVFAPITANASKQETEQAVTVLASGLMAAASTG